MSRPIVISMGDPAGIGPEVLAKVLDAGPSGVPLTLVGGAWALEAAATVAGVRLPEIPRITSPAATVNTAGTG